MLPAPDGTYSFQQSSEVCALDLNNETRDIESGIWNFDDPKSLNHCVNILKNRLVIVKCEAPWCKPCRDSAPAFHSYASQFKNMKNIAFGTLNVDENPSQFPVNAVPAYVFILDGQILGNESNSPDIIYGADISPVAQKVDKIMNHINSTTSVN